MARPATPAQLDGLTVGVIPGDTEQLVVPSGGFARRSQESVVIDRTALLADLKPQRPAARRRPAPARRAGRRVRRHPPPGVGAGATRPDRTAATYESWLDDRVTQSAVAWILATVFVRFCEDNGLIDLPVLAGPATGSR